MAKRFSWYGREAANFAKLSVHNLQQQQILFKKSLCLTLFHLFSERYILYVYQYNHDNITSRSPDKSTTETETTLFRPRSICICPGVSVGPGHARHAEDGRSHDAVRIENTVNFAADKRSAKFCKECYSCCSGKDSERAQTFGLRCHNGYQNGGFFLYLQASPG